MPDQPPNDKTVQSPPRLASDQFLLQVMSVRGPQNFLLQRGETVTIGRGDKATLRVDDPSLSRVHASLRCGPPFMLTDLRSSNGTHLRDVRLEPEGPVEVHPGEVFELGDVFCLVRGGGPGVRRARLRSYSYFEERLEDACAEAREGGAAFVAMRVQVDETCDPQPVEDFLLKTARLGDVVAGYAEGDYAVLRLHTAETEAKEWAERLRDAAVGVGVRVGGAAYPRDGKAPHKLIARAAEALRPPGGPEKERGDIVVADRNMLRLHALLERVAREEITVLLLGETGVGKEVFARRLHDASGRAGKKFVAFNGAALVDTLAENQLFGHERGAFTGATGGVGLLEEANGGTVFIDEVGELSLAVQAKLLRVLETRTVLPLGANRPRPIDVRIVAATNRDLEAECRAGRFREDLRYRLNTYPLVIPPLRERVAEIEPLARRFVATSDKARRLQRAGERPISLSPKAVELLLRHDWPGNVRELRNVMERAVVNADEEIGPEHLSFDVSHVARNLPVTVGAGEVDPAWTADENQERERLLATLSQCRGNQTRAAALLDVPRGKLIRLLEKYRISGPMKQR